MRMRNYVFLSTLQQDGLQWYLQLILLVMQSENSSNT